MSQQNDNLPPFPDLDLIFVEGGEFMMGDEVGDLWDFCSPVHPVLVSSFYMAKFPVTQRLYQAVMGSNPSYFKGDLRPVEMVSWDDAQAFIEKLNTALSSPQGTFRLPTEAEWEFAARGGNKSERFKYAGSNEIKEVAWFGENSYDETKAVGLKYPNELGLYDMSGNVREWCGDWFNSDYYKQCESEGLAVNPNGPDEGFYRVRRGSCYWHEPEFCRVASRGDGWAGKSGNFLSFRIALSLLPLGNKGPEAKQAVQTNEIK
ncbi:MAG: formylglycine-generating enzyme family protein [Saprospiraceae bacterium]